MLTNRSIHRTNRKIDVSVLSSIEPDPILAFRELRIKDTTYATHGYHKYPAKFIPQLAAQLIDEYTREGDTVVDPFAGCGTTLVESKINGRISIGVDINPVAVLIAKTKSIPIFPSKIEEEYERLQDQIASSSVINGFPFNERIHYWFKEQEIKKIAILLENITRVQNKNCQQFFYCAFSNILKSCSIWMQKSIKPIRDWEKIPRDPLIEFKKQMKIMLRGNADFYTILKERNRLKISSRVMHKDAKKSSIKSDSVDLIVTSPPYVTSYEYADVHQLTAFWLKYTTELRSFREGFIGSSYRRVSDTRFNSDIAQGIFTELIAKKANSLAQGVAAYFAEMLMVFKEMHRILKKRGRACIVIGNTELRDVKILNAESFVQQLEAIGFFIAGVTKREIPSKTLPSIRDKSTGRFARTDKENSILAYPTEYIIVAEKT